MPQDPWLLCFSYFPLLKGDGHLNAKGWMRRENTNPPVSACGRYLENGWHYVKLEYIFKRAKACLFLYNFKILLTFLMSKHLTRSNQRKQTEEAKVYCGSGFKGYSPPRQGEYVRESIAVEWPEVMAGTCSYLGGPGGRKGASWCSLVFLLLPLVVSGTPTFGMALTAFPSQKVFLETLSQIIPKGVLHPTSVFLSAIKMINKIKCQNYVSIDSYQLIVNIFKVTHFPQNKNILLLNVKFLSGVTFIAKWMMESLPGS